MSRRADVDERLQLPPGIAAAEDVPGLAALRSRCYAMFARAFACPDADALRAMRSGATLHELASLVHSIGPGGDWRTPPADVEVADTELQAEFTRLFEAGETGPACPLNESCYRRGPMEAMESILRFYEFFGLGMGSELRQEPDHLRAELEFMHFLAFQEEQLRRTGESPIPLQHAQRDFLGRHLAAWVPAWLARLEQSEPMPCFRSLAELLAAFIAGDHARLRGLP